MPGPHKIGRLAVGIENFEDRRRSFLGRNARAAAFMIDRHGESRLQRGGIVLHHQRQIEPLGHLGQNRHAELTPPVGNHEIDYLRGHFFGRADEIALVFAVFGVNDDDYSTRSDGFYGGFNC